MNWIILSLLAAAFWGAVNVIDKITVEKYITQPVVYLLFGGFASILPAAFIFIFYGIDTISTISILLSISTGIILISYTYFFFMALQKDDAPIVIALFQLVPVFAIIWGHLIFGERFSLITYAGIAVVLISLALLSIEFDFKQIKNSRISSAIWLMVLASFIASIGYAVQKYLLSTVDFKTIFFWGRIGDMISVAFLCSIRSIREALMSTLKRMLKYVLVINISNEVLNSMAVLVLIAAYSLGTLSLVTTLSATQPLFILLFIKTVNAVRPNTVPDTADGTMFIKRLTLIVFIVVGIYFISTGAS